jgi:translocation and assembly module TamB
MSRRTKIAIWVGAGFFGVLLCVAIALFVVPNTNWGRGFIVKEVSKLTDGQVRLAGLKGSFPAALDLDRLEVSDKEGLWLWADHVALRWSPGALLTRHVDIASLHVALLHVERTPVAQDKHVSNSSSSIPDTDLKDLSIDTLELGDKLVGNPAALSVKAHAHLRSLDDADVYIAAERLAGDGQYVVEGHLDHESIQASLDLHEPPNGPLAGLAKWPGAGAVAVHATLAGPRAAEDLALSADVGPLQARAQGRLNLDDRSAELRYSLVAPPMSPVDGVQWEKVALQGELHGLWTQLEAQGTLQVTALQVPGGTRVAALDARLGGNQGVLHLTADIDGLRVPGSAPKLLEDSRLTLDATVHLDDPARPLVLTANHRLFALNANAITAGDKSADITLRLPDLRPLSPLAGAKLRGDAQLTAHVTHSPASTRATAELTTHLDGGDAAWSGLLRGGATQAQMTAILTDQRIQVEHLRVRAPGVSLTGDAETERTGDEALNARFDVKLPDLHRVAAAVKGNLSIEGSIKGPRNRFSADTQVHANLSVRGSPPAGLTARLQATGLPQTPNGVIDAAGQLDGEPLRVAAEVHSLNAGEYRAIIHHADWKSAHAEGDVSLTPQAAAGRAAFQFGDLSDLNRLVGEQLAGNIAGHLVFGAESHRPTAHVEVTATNIQVSGVAGNARFTADGPLNALKTQLDANSPGIAGSPASLSAAVVFNLEAKELALNSLQASYESQTLHLLNPASVQYAPDVRVHTLNLGIQEATLSLDGQVAPSLDFHASVKNIKPALINAFIPDVLTSGTVDADVILQGTTAAPSGSIRLEALNLRAKSADGRGLPATDLRSTVTLNDGIADIDALLTAGSDSRLNLNGKAGLSTASDLDLKLAGSINLALANPMLEAAGRRITGSVQLDTHVTGSRSAPRIAGGVRINNGSFRDYAQGVTLTDIVGQLTGDQGELRIGQLTARAAPGTIAIEGSVGVLQPGVPVDIHLTAKNAQPIAGNMVTANLDADVRVGGKAREALDVNGTIHVNHAELNIPGGLPPEIAVLDVERDGAPPKSRADQALTTNLQVDVDAPNRILIKGRGLDAELGGQLHVTGTAAAPRVDGSFELQRGTFTLANSKLKFTEGSVTFNGTGLQQKIDPTLDFTAQAQAAEVLASVHITGLADAPKIALSSTPELPQDEILARLLFGEPAAQLTTLELFETGVALASLRGGSNGPSLNPIDRVQKALGLDRLSVGSGSTTSGSSATSDQKSAGTSVQAGRYVSSRVYVGVKESTAGASQVDVDVDLTRHLKLEAQLGNGSTTAQGVTPENDPGNSLGLVYQFEY